MKKIFKNVCKMLKKSFYTSCIYKIQCYKDWRYNFYLSYFSNFHHWTQASDFKQNNLLAYNCYKPNTIFSQTV